MEPVFRTRRSRRIVSAAVLSVVILATISSGAFIAHRALSAEGYACRIITHVVKWGESTKTIKRTKYEMRKTWWKKERVAVGTSRSTKTVKHGPSVITIPAFALPKFQSQRGFPNVHYGLRYSAGVPMWETEGTVVGGTRMKFRHDLIVSSEPDCAGDKQILPIGLLDAMEVEQNEFGRWTPDYPTWLSWGISFHDPEMGLEETIIWLSERSPT